MLASLKINHIGYTARSAEKELLPVYEHRHRRLHKINGGDDFAPLSGWWGKVSLKKKRTKIYHEQRRVAHRLNRDGGEGVARAVNIIKLVYLQLRL